MIGRSALLYLALAAVLTLTACSSDGNDDPAEDDSADVDTDRGQNGESTDDDGARDAEAGPGEGALTGALTVFAAASLNEVFEDIADLFTARHPSTDVQLSFAGSSDLVAQLDAGAPADVLATANESTMEDAVDDGSIAGEPVIFADNVLTLITPAGNPAGITGLDESLDGVNLVICAPQVPCGAATQTLTELVDVTLSPVSEESNVTDVMGKVTSGQADAGLVYTTDAATAGDAVEVIEVPGAQEVINLYPIATTAGSAQPELAAAWVDFVLDAQAQQVLGEAGFGAP